MHMLRYRNARGQQVDFPLAPRTLLVGRHFGNDLVLTQHYVSRRHFGLFWAGDGFLIEDLGSRGGTWIGTDRIVAPVWLKHGDLIRAGNAEIVYLDVANEEAALSPREFSHDDGLTSSVRLHEFRCWWSWSAGHLLLGWRWRSRRKFPPA